MEDSWTDVGGLLLLSEGLGRGVETGGSDIWLRSLMTPRRRLIVRHLGGLLVPGYL